MKFDFGTAYNRFFRVLGQHAGLFFVLGLVGIVLPVMAQSYLLWHYYGISATTQQEVLKAANDHNGLAVFGGWFVVTVFRLLNLSMVTEAAILGGAGKKVEAGALLGHAFANIFPLIGIGILVTLIVIGGMILLIVPGIMWALATCIAVPAYVGQPGIGIGGAISRSFELTRGSRWWLLLIFIVGMVAVVAIGAAWEGVVLAMPQYPLVDLLGSSAVNGLADVLSNVFVAAIYVALRESREGLAPDRAASVFQ